MSARRSADGRAALSIAILVSGEGTTMDALAGRVADGTLSARIAAVVADRPQAPAVERATRRGLPLVILPSRGVEREVWAARLTAELESRGTALVVLAGFLTILPTSWSRHWAGRAINLHPALLPRFGGPGMYGPRVHRSVLDAGETESGATVHLVTPDVDEGPILAQARVPVLPGDTPDDLRARIHPVEVALLAETIERFARGELPLPYSAPGAPASRPREGSDDR